MHRSDILNIIKFYIFINIKKCSIIAWKNHQDSLYHYNLPWIIELRIAQASILYIIYNNCDNYYQLPFSSVVRMNE